MLCQRGATQDALHDDFVGDVLRLICLSVSSPQMGEREGPGE